MIGIIRKFFSFCGPENRRKFNLSIICGILMALFEGLRIPAIYVMIKALLGTGVTTTVIYEALGIMLVSIFGEALVRNRSTLLQVEAGYGTCAMKRIEIADHLRYLPMGYFNERSLGNIISVTTNTMQNLENVATRVIMMVTQGLLTTLVILLLLFIFDWRIAIVLAIGLALFLSVNSALQKESMTVSARLTDSNTALVDKVIEYIQGMAEVKAYHLTGKKNMELEATISHNVDMNTLCELKFIPYMTLQNFIVKATGTAMTALSVFLCCTGSMDTVTCILMVIASFLVYSALESAGNYSALLRTVDISTDKANAILSTPQMDTRGHELVPENLDITAEGISFAYEKRKIIDNVSLSIPERSSLAIVGRSGGGKTTLTSLISRFWDVDEGRVTLGGHDVREYSIDSLMRNYSFVFQHVYLFNDTIANNIRFGTPEASMEQVIEAAKRACCHEFITALPDGYDTVIGEGGTSLSGGEKQRISIARAIMKDSPIIILDEATANVDPENEAELMKAIDELTREKTVIMIAHRLKTVRNADQIIVVDKGTIAQKGTHDELMQEEGIYRSFIEERRKAVSWKL